MKKSFKILSIFVAITLCFCACGKTNSVSESTTVENITNTEGIPVENTVLKLPYNEADGVNPFFVKSYENIYLTKLLYSPLFSISSAYDAIPVVAESINVNGNMATVTIKNGLSCRGSSNLNASDVVYSFNLAKNSYAFADSLKSIEYAEVSGSGVTFVSSFADIFVAKKLTFPIVKSGTADLLEDVPSGFGDYYLSGNSLVSTSGEKPTINLTSVNTTDTAFNAYKIGNTDIFFSDLSDCNYAQSHGQMTSIDLNNMVYLGINGNLGGLNKNIRSAIAVLLSSEDIAAEAYQGHAVPCKMPCNPSVSNYIANERLALSGNRDSAMDILDRLGYTRYAGKALTNGAFVLSFSLIVNSDNKYRVAAAYQIADALNEIGFYIEVKPLSFEDYNERISSGNYELYLGEVKLDSSMDISQFFLDGGAFASSIDKENVADAYFQMRSGEISYEEFTNVFVSSFPFVPIAFRTGYAFSSSNFHGDFSRTPFDLYFGL